MAGIAGSQPADLSQDVQAAPAMAPVPKGSPAPEAAAATPLPAPSEAQLAAIDAQFQKPQPSEADLDAIDKQFQASDDKPSMARTGVDQAVNAALFGYAPQVVGAGNVVDRLLHGDTNIKQNYLAGRDSYDKQLQNEQQAHPNVAALGAGTGMIAPGLATGGESLPSSLGEAMLKGDVAGTAYGAAQNPGDTPGQLNPAQANQRADNANIGGITGGTVAGVLQGLMKALSVKPPLAKPDVQTADLLPEKQVTAAIDDVTATNEAAKQVGVQLRSDEIHPNDPKLADLRNKALASKQFQDAQMERAQRIREMAEQIKSSFATGDATAQSAVESASTADKFFGQQIGSFRQEVIRNSKLPTFELTAPEPQYTQQTFLSPLPQQPQRQFNPASGDSLVPLNQQMAMDTMTKGEISSLGQQAAWQPGAEKKMGTSQLQQTLQEMRDDFGFTDREGGGYLLPGQEDRKSIAFKKNMPPSQVNGFIGEINRLSMKVANEKGQLTPEFMDRARQDFQAMANANAPAPGEQNSSTFANAVKLKDAFRDDFMNNASQFLSEDSKAAFKVAMGRYSELKGLPGKVQKLFDKDSPATGDIVAWLDKGADANQQNIAGLKTAIQPESPEAWEAVGKAYTDRFFGKYAMPNAKGDRIGGYDWQGISKQLTNGSPQYERMASIIGEERTQQIANLAKASSAVQEADQPFKKAASTFVWAKSLVSLAKSNPAEVVGLLQADRAAAKLLGEPKTYQRINPQEQAILRNVYNMSISGSALGSTQGQPPQQ